VVSIGLAATLGPQVVARLAPAIEAAGFHALWVNDTPRADALEVLQAASTVTTRLTLAAGVLPVDRRSPAAIIADVHARDLPQERLMLGIGSGAASVGALDSVRAAATQLRGALRATIIVGALGPRMRRLAAEHADGPLLSWLTPDIAAAQAAEARAAASGTHVALYVRTAVDPAAANRMITEIQRYEALAAYAANFARLGIDSSETVLDAAARPVAPRLEEYRTAVDEVVLRAITPSDDREDYVRFIAAAAALL
jgi:alkanesulfonate monooxygenase SsuD/methylene tetrahydromethanopterin reductase-like flavin-dependent oxidoreductase (luciferase family)